MDSGTMSDQGPDTEILYLQGFDSHGTTRARYRGRWIEVEHGIPGETVRAEIVGKRRLRGRLVEILEAAPDRIEPSCVYFRDWQCGGCQWQQIAYQGQVERKRESVELVMREAGQRLAVTALHTLADPWRYRFSAGISLGKSAGFRRHGSLAIVPIRDCPISHPLIGGVMAALNDGLKAGLLPDYRGRIRLDVQVVGSVREGPLQQEHLAVDGRRLEVLVRPTDDAAQLAEADLESLTSFLLSLQEVGGVSILRPDGSIAASAGRDRSQAIPTVTVAGRPVHVAIGSFFQTNLLLLPDLIARIRQEVQPLAGKRVADVYGGVGVFGLFLAEEAREVVVIDSDPGAVEAGRRTAEQWGLSNIRFRHERAEEALIHAADYDVVIVDPPRSGLPEPVCETLAAARPPLFLYVSCLAQSLARDLSSLTEDAYQVEHLELFDFYPQTYHVELLAVLRARDSGGEPQANLA